MWLTLKAWLSANDWAWQIVAAIISGVIGGFVGGKISVSKVRQIAKTKGDNSSVEQTGGNRS